MDFEKRTDEQLIEMLREGWKEVTDFLMEKYKGLVRKRAKAMYLWGGENDDLIQEGMIGLLKAIRDFDPKAGASFYSFADLCISRQMYSAIKASQRQKHIPLNSYVSIYESTKGQEGEHLPLAETIEGKAVGNPEETILSEQYATAFEEELKKELSKLENRVLYLHLRGMDYIQIAEFMEKNPKAIDNALQRIKRKAKTILEKKC